jgi:hypothetical protein
VAPRIAAWTLGADHPGIADGLFRCHPRRAAALPAKRRTADRGPHAEIRAACSRKAWGCFSADGKAPPAAARQPNFVCVILETPLPATVMIHPSSPDRPPSGNAGKG